MLVKLFMIIIVIIFLFIILRSCCNNKYIYDNFTNVNNKPILWVYWENKDGTITPDYIKLCFETIEKHCSKSFNIIKLNNLNINKYLPEVINYDLSNLLIAQKVDFYRVYLLYKYGGLYIDADTLVLRDPIEIIHKLDEYDFVGFGCTGDICSYGYGRPSNGIMASKAQGILISRVLKNLKNKLKLDNNNEWNYFDLGKYIIWQELEKLSIYENYKYYHYSNHYDGTRDKFGHWIETQYLFSNIPIEYKNVDDLLFIVLYNSQMDDIRYKSREYLLNSDCNISHFFRKSLFE